MYGLGLIVCLTIKTLLDLLVTLRRTAFDVLSVQMTQFESDGWPLTAFQPQTFRDSSQKSVLGRWYELDPLTRHLTLRESLVEASKGLSIT